MPPVHIDELLSSLHIKGHHYLETALEDKRSHQPIGNGAFKGLIVRAVINDLSEEGLGSLDRYLEDQSKLKHNLFEYLLVTLQNMHVFSDEDPRFKKDMGLVYARIYHPFLKRNDRELKEHYLKQEREMLLQRAVEAKLTEQEK